MICCRTQWSQFFLFGTISAHEILPSLNERRVAPKSFFPAKQTTPVVHTCSIMLRPEAGKASAQGYAFHGKGKGKVTAGNFHMDCLGSCSCLEVSSDAFKASYPSFFLRLSRIYRVTTSGKILCHTLHRLPHRPACKMREKVLFQPRELHPSLPRPRVCKAYGVVAEAYILQPRISVVKIMLRIWGESLVPSLLLVQSLARTRPSSISSR